MPPSNHCGGDGSASLTTSRRVARSKTPRSAGVSPARGMFQGGEEEDLLEAVILNERSEVKNLLFAVRPDGVSKAMDQQQILRAAQNDGGDGQDESDDGGAS